MTTYLAFSVKERRPGCPLVQAAFGVSGAQVVLNFPTNTWLTSPTDDMRVYAIENEEQMATLVAMAEAAIR